MGKKNIIGLSTLLLVLLLGLFSVSYAYSYRITDSDCDLIINHVVTSGYSWKTTAKTKLKQYVNAVYNEFDTCVVNVYNQNYFQLYVYGFNKASVTAVNNAGNINYMGVTTDYDNNVVYSYSSSGNTSTSRWQKKLNFGSGSQLRSNYMVVSNDLGNNLFSGPWQNTNVLTFAPSEIFVFTRNSNLQYVNNGNIAIVNTSDRLGDVQQGHNYGAVEVSCNYWDKARNSWVEFYWFANANNNNSDVVDIYISDFVNSSNNNIFPNVLVQTTYHSNNPDEFETDYFQPFIIADSHTAISGDSFIPTDTFDDDNYYNDYMNTINSIKDKDNTDKITDTLTDNSQVDSMIQDFTSGDFAGTLGYNERENPFGTFILAFVYDLCDVLIDDENPYWDYSMHGETPTRLYASDFVTPSTPLKTFISLSMTFGSIYLVYIQLRHYIELINEGNAAKVLHDVDADVYFYKM